MNYVFARNINNTGETGIVDVDTLTIICLCTETHSETLLQALKISSNMPVIRRLPTTEDVKRWHQLLVGINEEAMQKDMEATFV